MFPADHSLVQGLISSSFRRSLQSTETTCTWDFYRQECSLPITTMKYLLEKPQSEFPKIVVQHLTCAEKTNKANCNKEDVCVWSGRLGECQYMDLRKGHEDSPCAKAASLHFDLAEAKTQCPKQDSAERCKSKTYCQWNSRYRYCSSDEHSILNGIKNFEDKLYQVQYSVEAQTTVEVQYAALQSSDNFTWESLLDYKPSLERPSDIEQLVCDFIVAFWSGMINPQLYCQGEYEFTASNCTADPLCVWNTETDECERNDSTTDIAAEIAADKILIASTQEGTQKSISEAVSACATILESTECKGQYIWNLELYQCKPRKDYIAALLIEPGKNTTDALCEYIKTDGSSDCYNRFSDFFDRFNQYERCKSEFCRFTEEWRCIPKEEFYLSAAADRDPKLKERYQSLKQQCSSHITEEACVQSTKVY